MAEILSGPRCLFEFLFEIGHGGDHLVEGRFQGPKGLMDFICDDGALGGWFDDAIMFESAKGVPDHMLGLTGDL